MSANPNSGYRTPEQGIVNACLELLHLRGVFAWRQNQGLMRRKDRHGERFILGVLPGGRLIAVECKAGRNRPTDDQQAFLDAVNRRGGLGLVVYDVDDLADILDRELRKAAA